VGSDAGGAVSHSQPLGRPDDIATGGSLGRHARVVLVRRTFAQHVALFVRQSRGPSVCPDIVVFFLVGWGYLVGWVHVGRVCVCGCTAQYLPQVHLGTVTCFSVYVLRVTPGTPWYIKCIHTNVSGRNVECRMRKEQR